MSKPKRIRAIKAHIDPKGHVATTWEAVRDDTPYAPCYILRQSDIRALAEQMANELGSEFPFLAFENPVLCDYLLYAFRLHGITPGKKGTQ